MPARPNSFIVLRDRCPICSSPELARVYKRSYDDPRMWEYMELAYQGNAEYEYLVGHDFEIVECPDCRFLFQTNVLNEVGSQRLYDAWINADLAEQWSRERSTDERLWRGILHFVQRHLQRPEVKMLDYGAGFGQVCHLGKNLGFDVSALEFSKERAAILEERGIRPIMPGEERQTHYDFINLNQVLEHLFDPLGTLQRVKRALRDDGLVFLSVPNCRRLKRSLKDVDSLPAMQFQKALLDCSALQHINSFTEHALKKICEEAGFKKVFRPLLFITCSGFGVSPKALAKNLIRPFYYHFGTTFFLQKAN